MVKMSREARLNDVRVENGRMPQAPRTNEFVYVNNAFVGSDNNVSSVARSTQNGSEVISGVYREQYCVCSRWPYTQRILAVTVGLLLGALIGMSVSFFLDKEDVNLSPLLRRNPVPD